jgi:hypothetical protein
MERSSTLQRLRNRHIGRNYPNLHDPGRIKGSFFPENSGWRKDFSEFSGGFAWFHQFYSARWPAGIENELNRSAVVLQLTSLPDPAYVLFLGGV